VRLVDSAENAIRAPTSPEHGHDERLDEYLYLAISETFSSADEASSDTPYDLDRDDGVVVQAQDEYICHGLALGSRPPPIHATPI
jgi:hypothetical protein